MVSRLSFRLRHCLCVLIPFFASIEYYRDAAKSQPTSEPKKSIQLYLPDSGWVSADLDGDREPDFAAGRRLGRTKDGYFYQVQLQLSSDGRSDSFTVLHNDALGLKITGVDIDGDDDIDLIISDRFCGQHIGIWLNDGKGRFLKSLPGLFSPSPLADLTLVAADPSLLERPTGQSERRLPDCLAAAGYIRPLPLKSYASNQHPVEWIVRSAVHPFHQRAPPTPLAES